MSYICKKTILIVNILFIITLTLTVNRVSAINQEWIEVARTNNGMQFIDILSIHETAPMEISVYSRYLPGLTKSSERPKEIFYVMNINCRTSEYRDLSVNGVKNTDLRWLEMNNDKLIQATINTSCSYYSS